MKNLYNISSDEKKRILMLHEQIKSPLDAYKLPTPDFKKSNVNLDFNKKPADVKNNEANVAFDKWYNESMGLSSFKTLINNNNGNGIMDIVNYEFKDKPEYIPKFKELLVAKHSTLKFDVVPSVGGNVIKPGVYSKEVEDLQKKLNEKFTANLVVDGKWGPKTSGAVIKFIPAT